MLFRRFLFLHLPCFRAARLYARSQSSRPRLHRISLFFHTCAEQLPKLREQRRLFRTYALCLQDGPWMIVVVGYTNAAANHAALPAVCTHAQIIYFHLSFHRIQNAMPLYSPLSVSTFIPRSSSSARTYPPSVRT